MNDLVSIIIPYFKKKKFIKQTINSIFKQTYKKYEIIIIYDDKDLTDLSYLKKAVKKIKKKKIIINKKNYGAGISRNIGIKNAHGKFIAFLDADDVWAKNKLKEQIKFMKKEKVNFSYTSYSIINENNRIIKIIPAEESMTYNKLVKSCDIGLSTVIMKSNLFNKHKFPSIKTKEDYVLWLQLSKHKIGLFGLKRNLCSWRKLNKQLSSSIFQKLKDAFTVYNKYLKFNFLKSLIFTIILSSNFIIKRYL